MKMSHFFDFYSSRIAAQTARINMSIATLTAKFGGAVGTHAALKTAFPDINWDEYSDNFVAKFGLIRTKYTTQIDSYDSYCNLLNDFKQFAIILKDFAQNVWNYIRDGVFM
jgi:adenylosuccinate lyase